MKSRTVGFVLAATFSVFLWAVHGSRVSDLRPGALTGRAELAAVLGNIRVVEGRILELPHAPLGAVQFLDPQIALRALQEIQRAAESMDLPGAQADVALIDLLSGKLDNAVLRLENALKRAPKDARLLSDAAAMYLARRGEKEQVYDLSLALVAAARAVQADPSLPEAWFNLALALEKNFVPSAARSAWERYLELDSRSPWADEARQRLESLRLQSRVVEWDEQRIDSAALAGNSGHVRDLVKKHPQPARLYAEKKLLALWGKSYGEGGHDRARMALDIARQIGAAMVVVSGDAMVQDAIAVIDRALAAPNLGRVALLAEGHQVYGEGLDLMAVERYREAEVAFERSWALLEKAKSPFRDRAVIRLASCAKSMMNHRKVLSRVEPLRRGADGKRYPNLMGEVFWQLGVANLARADFSLAVSFYQEAVPYFQRTREVENVAFLNYMIAEALRYQGAAKEASQYRHEALKTGKAFPLSIPFHNALMDSAEAALGADVPEVAIFFQDEMVHNALNGGTHVSKIESLLLRSRTQHRLGRSEEAHDDLHQAEMWLREMEEGEMRDRLSIEIEVIRGDLRASVDPRSAAESIGKGIALFREEGKGRLPKLFLDRALALRAAGEEDLAEKDLEASIQESERQRAGLLADPLSLENLSQDIPYFDQAQRAFDEMIELQLERQDSAGAFAYSERSLMRTLLDRLDKDAALNPRIDDDAGSSPVLGLGEIQERIPGNVALVEYALVKGEVLVWVIQRDRSDLLELPMDLVALQERVEELTTAMHARKAARRSARHLQQLYGDLVRPVLAKVDPEDALIFIPDKFLNLVPFAGLLDSRTNRYLIEDRLIANAPSANLYVRSLQNWVERQQVAKSSVLAIGNPALDRSRFPDLPDLSGAEAEARSAAALFGGDLLTDEEATKSRFLESAPEYSMIHLGVHARIYSEFPLLSYFVLAPDRSATRSGEPGKLYAHEIYQMRLPKTSLVVLAACESANGPVSASEGISSLVRPFLAAGVPVVLGSLWPMEDKEASEVFKVFYERLKAGDDPGLALRKAQLNAIERSHAKKSYLPSWAGVQIVGGFWPAADELRRHK